MHTRNLPKRKSTRLHGYDYKLPGGYFITICSYKRTPLFSKIVEGRIMPTQIGKIVQHEWFEIPKHRGNVILHKDEFVLMPDHIHAIVWIDDYPCQETSTEFKHKSLESGSLGAIIGQFKSKTSRLVNQLRNTPGETIWQRNYYDRIIRNDKALIKIRKYILNNPLKWEE